MQQCNHFLEADDHHSLEEIMQDEGQPTTSAAARREDCVRMHEKLTMEFHEHKLMYLKEEHDMKMQILHVVLVMKEERNRKQQQYQCSSQTSTSSESRYFHL